MIKTRPIDLAEFLTSEEAIAAFLEETAKLEGAEASTTSTESLIARARELNAKREARSLK